MSLWVEPPVLVDTQSGRTLIRFSDPNWSLDSAAWESESVVRMKMRKFPGNHIPPQFDVVVDCASHSIRVESQAPREIAKIELALEEAHARGGPPGTEHR